MLIQIDSFLGEGECARLREAYERYAPTAKVRDSTGHAVVYWDEFKSAQTVRELVSNCVGRAARALTAVTMQTLFAETLLLACIGKGGMHSAHADNCKQDGNGEWVPNHTPMRHYSMLLYLNGDFEGGEIRFLNQGLAIRPRTGLLVAFPSDHRYVHEVPPVESGARYSMPIWFTRNKDNALPDFR